MKFKQAYIKRIKELLKRNHMTQYQLFKASGVPQSTISTILNGDIQTIKIDTLFDLCFGLKVELSEFFDCDYLKF